MNPPAAQFRKIAIVVDSLDSEQADALLGQLPVEQAQQVRNAVMSLSSVTAEEANAVIAAFLNSSAPGGDAGSQTVEEGTPGVELDARLAARFNGPTELPAPRAAEPEPHEPSESPFAFLHDANCRSLVPRLSSEHPQTVAVVLAHLPHRQAADVLLELPDAMQAEVVRRLAYLEELDPQVLREVERQLQSWMSEHRRYRSRRAAGVSAVSSILEAAGTAQRSKLIHRLRERDIQLAGKLAENLSRPVEHAGRGILSPSAAPPQPVSAPPSDSHQTPTRTMTFDEFAMLPDETLRSVLHRVESELVVLALAGAEEVVFKRMLRLLAADQQAQVSQAIESLGPTRLSDVHAAQRELARVALQLARENQPAQVQPHVSYAA